MHFELSAAEAGRRLAAGGGGIRKERSRNLLEAERVEIGVEAKFAKAKEVAERWGISPSTVAQIRGGFIQTSAQRAAGGPAANARDVELVDGIEEKTEVIKTKVISTATQKLLAAMNEISEEKLAAGKLRELSAVARDMAIVIEKAEGKGIGGVNNGVNVRIFAPSVMHPDDIPTLRVERDGK